MKIVLQDGIKDCGICCLLSIIRYYGGEVSKEYLREITYTTKDGVSLYNLLDASKKIGFESIGLSGNIDDIEIEKLPCIAHFIINKSYKHFVVIYKIDKIKKKVTLMDPAKGKKIISFSEFKLLSSNNYLFLKPIKKLPIIKKKNIIYKKIKLSIKNNKKDILIILLITISFFIINILTSYHFKYLLEYSINNKIIDNIKLITHIILLLYIIKELNTLIRTILINKWLTILDIETTTDTYRQLLLLPYLYYKNRTTGEVISRFKDLNIIRNFFSNILCTLQTDILCIIIFLILMFKINKLLTLIIIIVVITLILNTILFKKSKKKLIIKVTKGEDIINSSIIEGLSNVDTIKGSHLEKRLIDLFTIKYKSFQENNYSLSLLITVQEFIKNIIYDILIILIYAFGSYFVIKEKLNLSSLIIYQSFINYLLSSTLRSIKIIEEYPSFKISLDRVEELFMIKEEEFKNNYFYLPYNLEGDIIIKNLNYKIGYKDLFKDLNLTIKQGEKILLTGPSGCGKSTLVKMLMRYVEVDFNIINIANIDINHYHLNNIRTNITYVSSNEYLFNDTLKNNITLYKEYPDEEIEEVCKICLVNDIIKNSDIGLNRMIEENGFNFSSGEKQRIFLARSIIKKTNIYIFDEALGQIDINREKQILEEMFKYLKDKTIIVISHRNNNKKLFDRVLKLEKGKINEN